MSVAINSNGVYCWTVGYLLFQPLEHSRYPIVEIEIEIDGELVVIDFIQSG
jgi:hypothetical protein